MDASPPEPESHKRPRCPPPEKEEDQTFEPRSDPEKPLEVQEGGIEKGRQEGRQEGLQEGLQQGRQEDIEKLLSKGILSPPEIASVLEVDRAWVEEIAKHIAGRK